MVTIFEAWDGLQERHQVFTNLSVAQILDDIRDDANWATLSAYEYLENGKTFKRGTIDIRPYKSQVLSWKAREEDLWSEGEDGGEPSDVEVSAFYKRYDKAMDALEGSLYKEVQALVA